MNDMTIAREEAKNADQEIKVVDHDLVDEDDAMYFFTFKFNDGESFIVTVFFDGTIPFDDLDVPEEYHNAIVEYIEENQMTTWTPDYGCTFIFDDGEVCYGPTDTSYVGSLFRAPNLRARNRDELSNELKNYLKEEGLERFENHKQLYEALMYCGAGIPSTFYYFDFDERELD